MFILMWSSQPKKLELIKEFRHDKSPVHTGSIAHCFNKFLQPHRMWHVPHLLTLTEVSDTMWSVRQELAPQHWNHINHLARSARGAVPDQANNTPFSLLSLLFPGPLFLSERRINLCDPAIWEGISAPKPEKWGTVLAWRLERHNWKVTGSFPAPKG